jgi:hypothetical protein
MAIVDRLEFVEVEIHQGRCRLVAFDVSQGTGKRALEAAPIEGLGERSTSIRFSSSPMRWRDAASSAESRSTSTANRATAEPGRCFAACSGSAFASPVSAAWRCGFDRAGSGAARSPRELAALCFTPPLPRPRESQRNINSAPGKRGLSDRPPATRGRLPRDGG